MSYTPKPGTVADRVLAHMATLPHGAEVCSSQIAEALGINAMLITSSMLPALEYGLVFRRQKDKTHSRAPVYWSLVDHASKPGDPVMQAIPATDEQDARSPGRRADTGREAATAPNPAAPVTEEQRHAVERRASAPAAPPLVVTPITKRADLPPPTHAFKDIGWLSGGSFVMVRHDGEVIVLPTQQADQLEQFMRRGRAAA
jgi:hypothetical protein